MSDEVRKLFLEGRYDEVVAAYDAAENARRFAMSNGYSMDPSNLPPLSAREGEIEYEELVGMFREIEKSITKEESRFANKTKAHQEQWDRFVEQRRDAEQRGLIPELPFDPDIDPGPRGIG